MIISWIDGNFLIYYIQIRLYQTQWGQQIMFVKTLTKTAS
jgi:hypothetical protein